MSSTIGSHIGCADSITYTVFEPLFYLSSFESCESNTLTKKFIAPLMTGMVGIASALVGVVEAIVRFALYFVSLYFYDLARTFFSPSPFRETFFSMTWDHFVLNTAGISVIAATRTGEHIEKYGARETYKFCFEAMKKATNNVSLFTTQR